MEQEMLKYIDKKLKGDEAEEQTEQVSKVGRHEANCETVVQWSR